MIRITEVGTKSMGFYRVDRHFLSDRILFLIWKWWCFSSRMAQRMGKWLGTMPLIIAGRIRVGIGRKSIDRGRIFDTMFLCQNTRIHVVNAKITSRPAALPLTVPQSILAGRSESSGVWPRISRKFRLRWLLPLEHWFCLLTWELVERPTLFCLWRC